MKVLTNGETIKLAARFMDKNYPNWFESINTNKLRIADARVCIGGQTGVDWEVLSRDFQNEMQLETLNGRDEGGEVLGCHPFAASEATKLWVTQVNRRKRAANKKREKVLA